MSFLTTQDIRKKVHEIADYTQSTWKEMSRIKSDAQMTKRTVEQIHDKLDYMNTRLINIESRLSADEKVDDVPKEEKTPAIEHIDYGRKHMLIQLSNGVMISLSVSELMEALKAHSEVREV